jgi:hypothetical protein
MALLRTEIVLRACVGINRSTLLPAHARQRASSESTPAAAVAWTCVCLHGYGVLAAISGTNLLLIWLRLRSLFPAAVPCHTFGRGWRWLHGGGRHVVQPQLRPRAQREEVPRGEPRRCLTLLHRSPRGVACEPHASAGMRRQAHPLPREVALWAGTRARKRR